MNKINSAFSIEKVKTYHCQRCLNHGLRVPRRGHKRSCVYADCVCTHCALVEERKLLNKEINQEVDKPLALTRDETELNDNAKGRRPTCARCAMHIPDSAPPPLKGHKRKCPFQNCYCRKCHLVNRRRTIMAKQIHLRRIQTSPSDEISLNFAARFNATIAEQQNKELIRALTNFTNSAGEFSEETSSQNCSSFCEVNINSANSEISAKLYTEANTVRTLALPLIPASNLTPHVNSHILNPLDLFKSTVQADALKYFYENLGAWLATVSGSHCTFGPNFVSDLRIGETNVTK